MAGHSKYGIVENTDPVNPKFVRRRHRDQKISVHTCARCHNVLVFTGDHIYTWQDENTGLFYDTLCVEKLIDRDGLVVVDTKTQVKDSFQP